MTVAFLLLAAVGAYTYLAAESTSNQVARAPWVTVLKLDQPYQ
jgi:hypothetical protein